MNLYKVWYQLPMDESDDTFYYAAAWSAAHIYADSPEDAKRQVGALIDKNKELLDKIGFVFHTVERERIRTFSTAIEEIKERYGSDNSGS